MYIYGCVHIYICIYIYVFLRFHPTCLPIHFLPTLHLHQLEEGLILPDPQTGWLHSLQGPVLKCLFFKRHEDSRQWQQSMTSSTRPSEPGTCVTTQITHPWNGPWSQTSSEGEKQLLRDSVREKWAISHPSFSIQADFAIQTSFLHIHSIFWLKTMINLWMQQKEKLMF